MSEKRNFAQVGGDLLNDAKKKKRAFQTIVEEDGEVEYMNGWISKQEADSLFEQLSNLEWKTEQVRMYGKMFTPSRQIYYFGDKGVSYRYSGSEKESLEKWHPGLDEIRKRLEKDTGQHFNFALLNHYPDGKSYLGFHSDNEKGLKPGGIIASLSLGAERKFVFKHKKDGSKKIELPLSHGSMLLMKSETQQNWLHSLPKALRVKEPRINVTFRCIVTEK